eukprot:4159156-Amphidinium_carterae.1
MYVWFSLGQDPFPLKVERQMRSTRSQSWDAPRKHANMQHIDVCVESISDPGGALAYRDAENPDL